MQTKASSETTTKNTNKTEAKAETRATSVAKLEECLQGEISAVETYEIALKRINHVGIHHTLQEILASHARRTELLNTKFGRFGTDPPKGSGIWGAFAKIVQTGADLLGDRAAVAALEEGEDRGLKLYSEGLEKCDAKTRKFIETELLPEQKRTHELCRSLKQYTQEPS